MKIKNITLSLLAAFSISGSALLTSCDDDLNVGNAFDESAYEGIYKNEAFLRDAKTNMVSNIVELYNDSYSTKVRLELSKYPTASSTAKVMYDAEYLKAYNELHETEFELYPAESVSLSNEGVLALDPKQKYADVEMTIAANDAVDANKTYVIPLAITAQSGDLSVKEGQSKHCIYLVKDLRSAGDCFKGEDKPKGYLFFEVNDTNPLNAFSFQLENGKYLWDVVVLFAANINYDSESGRPRVQCNPNVQYLLDNNETLLQPLRKRGIKVLLGILGNHDMTGVAQLSKQGAKDFARELAQYCKAYNLDGVNFDDEYSSYPDLSNPSLTNRSEEAAARLCYETKQVMPDKLVTVFSYGAMYGIEEVDGVDVKNWIDIAVPNYGSSVSPIGQMSYKQCAGMAMEFHLGIGGTLSTSMAKSLMDYGYGWFMGFAPSPDNYPAIFSRLYGCETLYGSTLKNPSVYYKKNDPTPYSYNW